MRVLRAQTNLASLKCTLSIPPADCDRSSPFNYTYSSLASRNIFELYLDTSGAMGSPYHVPPSLCASHLLSCDEASFEFQALSLIAKTLVHPERTLLSTFVQQAIDRELAARFFLDGVVEHNKATIAGFLADWISLLRRGRSSSSSSNHTNNFISTSDRLREYGHVTQTEHMAERWRQMLYLARR
jgi:hypothetical protein